MQSLNKIGSSVKFFIKYETHIPYYQGTYSGINRRKKRTQPHWPLLTGPGWNPAAIFCLELKTLDSELLPAKCLIKINTLCYEETQDFISVLNRHQSPFSQHYPFKGRSHKMCPSEWPQGSTILVFVF
jgi:hypothetical protein